jgi:hypothetical protein
VLKKDDMVKKNMMQHVMAERSIMAKSSNPFIVKLSYAFQSKVPHSDWPPVALWSSTSG